MTAPRFKKGQSGNPSGVSRETRLLINENAARATRIRNMMLRALEMKLERAIKKKDLAAADSIQSEINTFIKDSENRGLGTPTQQVNLSGPGGGPLQSVSREMTEAEAAEAYRATLAGGAEEDDEPEDD